MIESDDFAATSLGSEWHFTGPSGTSAAVGSDGTDGYLQLVTPDGNYDVWGTNNGARVMQAAPNSDFQLETRFLTVPSQQYQMQGFLVEQDAQNWLRFDTYFDGSVLRAFAAVTLGGSSASLINVAIAASTAPYLRLTRTGNVWKFEYSQDDTTWITAGSFTQQLTVTAVGIFAGNTGSAVGYTARVDYFENTASPIVNEDGTIVPVNTIDVWYGNEQTFGVPGEAQQWINILGSVSGSVASLSYSLNGGPARALSLGPDTRRLQNPGDFNIDIAYSELDGSARDDVVTITEVMASGATFSRDVLIHYESGHTWAPNYSINWANVTNIQNVVQVLDGTWEIDNNGARPVDLGYDRLIAIGDHSWDNYELDLTITMHDLQNADPRGRDGGAFLIGMLWTGHTDDPIAGWQPKSGWTPGAAFNYSDDDRNGVGEFTLHPSTSFAEILATRSFALAEGHTYNFRVRVEQTGLYDRLYSLKVWEQGTAEPTGWTLQGTESFDISQAPGTGSIYFDAHYFDASFNNMTVSEIRGRDIVQGTSGNDSLSAAYSGNGNEIDVFAGYGGTDIFALGDSNGDHYAVGGNADYGFIWDFRSGVDKIQLGGTAADYVLATDYAGLPAGTAIFRATSGGTPGELIGVLNGARGLSLTSGDFVFVGGGGSITGGPGDDTLNGGPGNDRIDGGPGIDTMIGGRGDDTYVVDNTADKVIERAGEGTDSVLASANFTLPANVENLQMFGAGLTGQGNGLDNTISGDGTQGTKLNGLGGNDHLIGGSGNDVLNGGAGVDVMSGGPGDDTYYVDNAGDQVIEAVGGGSDTVYATVSWAMTGDQEIESVSAYGAGAKNGVTLTGNDFGSSLTGGGAVDHLNGGAGADRLNGLGGADVMAGGAGNDVYYVDNAADQVIEAAGGGSDTVYASKSWTMATGQEIESLNAYGAGATSAVTLTGNEFANTLTGGSGSDVLKGEAGNDTLFGGAGIDSLDGGSGADVMTGGKGDDAYYVDNAGDQVIEVANGGIDTVYASVDWTMTAGQQIEKLSAYGVGATSGLALRGNSFGNTLLGGAGNDILAGGGGKDKLTGGAGNDTFLFDSPLASGNIDTIVDFTSGDTIALDHAIFSGLSVGALSTSAFSSGSASGSNAQIVYQQSTGALFYDSNGSAAGGATQFAIVTGAPVLDHTSFQVV